MDLLEVLQKTLELKGSDVYIVPGSPIMTKIGGDMRELSDGRVSPADSEQILASIYEMYGVRGMDRLREKGDDDFSFSLKRLGRFRCSAYRQRGSLAAVLRVVPFGLPDPGALSIPQTVLSMSLLKRGMVLVTGPAGSGKTTTLACLVDRINTERSGHIITIEDPIEYLHPHKNSMVSQREIGNDTESFACALRASLRQAPDVILLGEMRDFETMQTALTAAETGHFLLSSLHTLGAAKTIDRVVDVFPADQQQQVRVQLSMVLRAVVSQQLIPAVGGGMVPAFEVMIVNSAIQNMIREGKVFQMDNVIYQGAKEGMTTMDADLQRLCAQGRITRQNALLYAINPDALMRRL